MAVRGSAVHKNHNPCILLSCLPFFPYPGHIFESTEGIKIKLATYIDVNERKYRRQEP